MSVMECRRRLATLWFIGSGVFAIFLIAQSYGQTFGKDPTQVWSLLLPSILPTLSLMIGVFVADMKDPDPKGVKGPRADTFFYHVTFYLSLGYLLLSILNIMIFVFNFTAFHHDPLGLLKMSQLWMAPLQGLVAASLGAFFVKR